jgi:hypothetical protein
METTTDCPICLSPIKNNLYITECCKKHFHKDCHLEWIKIKNNCPMCRNPTEETKLVINYFEDPEIDNCKFVMLKMVMSSIFSIFIVYYFYNLIN